MQAIRGMLYKEKNTVAAGDTARDRKWSSVTVLTIDIIYNFVLLDFTIITCVAYWAPMYTGVNYIFL